MEHFEQIPWLLVFIVAEALVGVVFTFVLLLMKFPAARHLGRLILSWLLVLIIPLFNEFYSLKWLFSVLVTLSLYWYTTNFFSQKTRLSYLYFLPLILCGVVYWLLPAWVRIVSIFLSAGYLIRLFQILRKEFLYRGIDWFLNPLDRIAWFRNFLILNITALCHLHITSKLQMISACILMLLILFLVGYQVVKESTFLTPIPLGNKYKKSTLTPAIKSSILNRLEGVLQKEFYLRNDASLSALAKELNASTHHLSQVLNESMKVSFQDLMAQYRIRKACELLKNKANEQVTIESIATRVGYNSKSAFNTAFKRRTGLTPSVYREAKNVRTYGEALLSGRKEPHIQQGLFGLDHVFNLKMKSGMIQHFLKIFGRNVKRNGLFSFFNVLGLTIGFTCSILIYFFLNDELSYDQSLPNYDRIFRVAWSNDNPQTRTPHPMAQAMVNDFPEVEQAVSLSPWYGPGLSLDLIRVKDVETHTVYEESGIYFADSTFFDVFELKIIDGDKDALRKPFSLVISQELAHKYFGNASAIGKRLELNGLPVAVSAVSESMPERSHFHFNAIIPYLTLKQINPVDNWMTWADFGHFNYIKLKKGTDALVVESKLANWISKYLDWWNDRKESLEAAGHGFILQPITSIHLRSNLRWELENNGSILYIYILSGTLLFLMLIVTINYMNLITAKSIERAKEVGVRKTLGAIKRNLSLQFYVESILFCLLAMLMSLGLAGLLLDSFNYLSGKSFEAEELFESGFLLRATGFCIFIALLAGIYPAFVLSSFKPTEVLKGKLTTSSRGVRLRGALVILQFTVSSMLISGSLIIHRQINFMKDKDLGFDQEALISLNVPIDLSNENVDVSMLRSTQQELERISGVKATTLISSLPGGQFNQHSYFFEDRPDNRVDASEVMVDFGIEEVFGLALADGRTFSRAYAKDSLYNILINQSMAERLNHKNPVGMKLILDDNGTYIEHQIIGIVKDFHFQSLHQDIQPLVMKVLPRGAAHIVIKLDGNQFAQTIAQIESIYNSIVDSELPFAYEFLDQQLAELYQQEERTLSIFSAFSIIALGLASLGLLGMAIAILNQRMKEVGLRKILGASPVHIMGMVLGQFAKLVMVATLIGLPVSYYLMQNWMTEFSYRAPLGVMPFVWAVIILMGVAMLSVISAVTKITFSNPVDALKYE
ncbi:MAG: ABC transporter permease [Bacteroidota bacterium]